MQNRDVFVTDPTTTRIPNDGVAKVLDPRTPAEWEVLRYELGSFVCDGEYRRGLELILSTYLANLARAEQPAVWVGGFYGSGKSHLVRVLEYLWRDMRFPDGATARGLAHLPQDIQALLAELSTVARREGGLWSAAGTLGAGAGNNVRMALLAILLRGAGLPTQYAPARFVVWLKQRGYYDAVAAALERRGESLERELNHMYVSPFLKDALLEATPDFASSPAEAREQLRTQYPPETEITDDQLLRMMEDVLALQATVLGRLPCTLLVFDELQQFLGEDPGRTLQVQNVVEACSSRFGSRLLFVATGQAALQATPQLSKLQGRFTVTVSLSDTDVEQVVRNVVLRKRVDAYAPLSAVLTTVSGEIDRQLAGSKIGPVMADAPDLVPDYPLLPVRRRFWERVLRAVDSAGTAGQLRTQLRIVHEAAKAVASRPVGTVVPGDMIYGQLKPYMLQSGILLRDIETTIEELDDGTPDGGLRARLCATIFLIGRLPTEGVAVTGVRASADSLADLLVEDLTAGSSGLRQRIPTLLQELVDKGALMLVGDEYRLQTRESMQWDTDYRRILTRILADGGRLAADRDTEIRAAVGALLKGVTLTQGVSRTPRKFDSYVGADEPPTSGGNVPVWVRDGWSVSERVVREETRIAGLDSPVVTVFLPNYEAEALKAALAGHAAARECIDARPMPSTPEGAEARQSMLSRADLERRRVVALIASTMSNARVFQGGGNEVVAASAQAAVREAMEAALVRLFPKFDVADAKGWDTVLTRAGQGSPDPLAAIGYSGDAEKHPVCAEVRAFIGGAGKRGGEARKHFTGAGYGWPQDAVDAALMALRAGGFLRAVRNGQPLAVKDIAQSQIGVIEFYSEGIAPPTAVQRIAVRKLIADMGLPCAAGEETAAIPRVLERLVALGAEAGGDPPLPARPAAEVDAVQRLQAMGGNEQFIAVYDRREQLLDSFKAWTQARDGIAARRGRWELLARLLRHAESAGLPVADGAAREAEAILRQRALLAEPDPVAPLVTALSAALRDAVQAARARLVEARAREVGSLEASEEWGGLSDEERRRIVAANALAPVGDLDIGTDERLLSALDATPLADWDDKLAALPGRVSRAREEAARYRAPQAVRVRPAQATLRTASDVDAYLAALRAEIMGHIEAQRPVIV